MSSGPVIVRLGLSTINRVLASMRDPDLKGAFNLARKPARQDIRAHAKAAAGPDGSWPARSPLTSVRKGKRKRARKLLGKLPAAIMTTTTRRSLILTSRAKWSGIHQDGGTAEHGARIPARPFLWASQGLAERIAGLVARGLVQAFGRAW